MIGPIAVGQFAGNIRDLLFKRITSNPIGTLQHSRHGNHVLIF